MIRRTLMFALGVLVALLIQQSTAYAGDPDIGSGNNHHPSATPTASKSPVTTPTAAVTVTVSPTKTPTTVPTTPAATVTQTPPQSPTVTPANTVSAIPVSDSLPVTGPGIWSFVVTGAVIILLGLGLYGLARGRGRRRFTAE